MCIALSTDTLHELRHQQCISGSTDKTQSAATASRESGCQMLDKKTSQVTRQENVQGEYLNRPPQEKVNCIHFDFGDIATDFKVSE